MIGIVYDEDVQEFQPMQGLTIPPTPKQHNKGNLLPPTDKYKEIDFSQLVAVEVSHSVK